MEASGIMPTQFMISLVGRIVATYAMITVLICGIYLVEQFVPLLEISLRYAFSGLTLGKLLVFIMPWVIDFALPLAVLCVTYFILLKAREGRELLIMSAAGASSTHLVVTILTIGTIAAAMSLLVSGFVKPAGSFAFRSTFNAALNEVLSKGVPTGSFYSQTDRILYSRPSESTPDRILRLFEFESMRLSQMILSDCARMRVENGVVLTETCDLQVYRFGRAGTETADDQPETAALRRCSVCPDQHGNVPLTFISTGASRFSFAMDDVFTSPVRNRSNELTLPELLAGRGDRFHSSYNAEVAAAKILSAFSSIAAVAIALVAVAWTTNRTRIVALPLACISMMGIMLLVNSQTWLLDVEAGRFQLTLKIAAIVLTSVPLTFLLARHLYGRLISPALSRP